MKIPHLSLVAGLASLLLFPALSAVADENAPHAARIILVGDSTVASGGGWGDAFAKQLLPGVECRNWAANGRSSKSYRNEGRWRPVLEAKPDWVLIQFGHNDQPGKGPKLETDASTTYRENLVRYIAEAREIGAQPVLVTSLTRRKFDDNGKVRVEDLAPYVEATREVARLAKVPLVDLNARGVEELNRLGPEEAKDFNRSTPSFQKPDTTHLSPKGAEHSAELVVEEIREKIPGLAKLLVPKSTNQPKIMQHAP